MTSTPSSSSLSQGARVMMPDDVAWLITAAEIGGEESVRAKERLLHEFDVNLVNQGDSPLFRAIKAQSPSAVALLLEAGADPNGLSGPVSMALPNWVQTLNPNYSRYLDTMLDHGADVNWAGNRMGDSAFHSAMLFFDYGGDNKVIFKDAFMKLLNRGMDPNIKNDNGHDLLWAARNSSNFGLVKIIQEGVEAWWAQKAEEIATQTQPARGASSPRRM